MSKKSAVVDERGRIVIPQHVRDALGITAGSLVSIELDGDGFRTIHEGNAREKLLAAFSEISHSMADKLVAERQEQR